VRAAERRGGAAAAEVCAGLPAIHYFVSGRAFRPGAGQRELSALEREEIATFGHVSHREEAEEVQAAARGYACESWRVEDESVLGVKMMRESGVSARRIAHGQLVALRPAGGRGFQLGHVRWLMTTDAGELACGVKYLPGIPQAVAVRGTGVNAVDERYVQAIALGAVPALKSPATLVLPSGWFRPKRVIEALMRTTTRLRLLEILERGADFERVSFEPLGG
jgi:hypothetical protein